MKTISWWPHWENYGNKDDPNENRQRLFRACYRKEVSPHPFIWQELKSRLGEWERFLVKKKKRSLRVEIVGEKTIFL